MPRVRCAECGFPFPPVKHKRPVETVYRNAEGHRICFCCAHGIKVG